MNEWSTEWVNTYISHQIHRTVNESMKGSVCAQITNKEFINGLNFHTYLVYLRYNCLYAPHTLGVQDKLECHGCFHDGPGRKPFIGKERGCTQYFSTSTETALVFDNPSRQDSLDSPLTEVTSKGHQPNGEIPECMETVHSTLLGTVHKRKWNMVKIQLI